MAKPSIKYITSADLFSIHFVPTLIVFLVMMVLIGFSWRTATQEITDTQNQQVDVRSQFVESNMRQRFTIYEDALRSGAGLFESSPGMVGRPEWHLFVNNFDLKERFPAMMGLGYVSVVDKQDLAAFEANIRAEGKPNFTVNTNDPNRQSFAIITYVEPDNDRNNTVLGGDIYNDAICFTAMEQARDENHATITDAVKLLQTDGSRDNGVTAFYPVYREGAPVNTVEERRQALQGFVYAPLQTNMLFDNIFQDNDMNFNVQIYDGTTFTPETLLYERYQSNEGETYVHIKDAPIQINNQMWTIRYSARSNIVSQAVRNRPNSIALGGTIFSMLLAGLVYLLLQRRSRQLADNENRKLDYAKDSMLSLASHQLRTPATGVKQYLGMVLEGFVGDITDDQKELLQRANESNDRQLRIINEFLYLAKADAGRIIISPQIFDIGDLTDSIVAEMSNDIALAGHEISVIQRAKAVPVFADPHSARMIIENLISNAIKYTPSGGKIVVTIRKNRTNSIVSVKDNGVGIAHKDFAKLFKQFSRIPNELTRQETGSGIGLYLADYLAELNGGKITVESKRHVGSTFSVSLPVKAVKNVTVS